MAKLELYYPAKPYVETQAWGIYNPAYLQFGFSKHNGRDFLLGTNKSLYAPCDSVVLGTGYVEKGAGNYISLRTAGKVSFNDMADSYVTLVFMHMESISVKAGQTLKAGDFLGIADNTGFSTGPHTHLACYRSDELGNKLDKNEANGTFDHYPYFNRYYAQDAQKVVLILKKIIELYKKIIWNG